MCKKIERGMSEEADADMQRRAKFGFNNCDAPYTGNDALRIGRQGENSAAPLFGGISGCPERGRKPGPRLICINTNTRAGVILTVVPLAYSGGLRHPRPEGHKHRKELNRGASRRPRDRTGRPDCHLRTCVRARPDRYDWSQARTAVW